MSLLRSLGKKQVAIAQQWIGSASTFGASAAVLGLYMTDWKVVLQYLPFYNGKFPKEN